MTSTLIQPRKRHTNSDMHGTCWDRHVLKTFRRVLTAGLACNRHVTKSSKSVSQFVIQTIPSNRRGNFKLCMQKQMKKKTIKRAIIRNEYNDITIIVISNSNSSFSFCPNSKALIKKKARSFGFDFNSCEQDRCSYAILDTFGVVVMQCSNKKTKH